MLVELFRRGMRSLGDRGALISSIVKQCPHRLRRIGYHDRETKKDYVFLTTHFHLAARTIADIYKSRWQVELFFKSYRPRVEKAAGYTVADHTQLAAGSPMRDLFEIVRREVLALDPCVSEEFLKLYVAYKAETNFVDIMPQKSRLRLSLNMQFHELHDPKGLAKDVTNLGRWGNGDVEVGLGKPEELPYVMGLVRQALEKQMGNGEAQT